WRVSLGDTGIAGEAGDAHNSVVLLEKWYQRVVIDRPVRSQAVERTDAKIRGMQAREVRRVHHRAAAHAVEVDDLNRRVVVVDRVILRPGANVRARGEVAEE